ncbi:hypothetical protein OK015_16730 [Mycobacterium sp. Aquia_216]|uniref:Rv1733c family protein n=1 Tax=Mycobacterium sp. Aquia_216 TaxID=2991729 RepID=UPI00227C55BD|nr:hypothetical protein [Mycobacterium sp. Aquia_216]WAJ42901.1 hypothetical protein OK015_16730 [Mycobacterium sp. Aquia_216]
METFTLDPNCWGLAHIFGRNQLLRRADRIEALVKLAVLVASLLAIPLAGVAGGITYSVRDRVYVEEARERHAVVATVIETAPDGSGMNVVQAMWAATTGEHTGPVELTHAAKVGDRIEIWVDNDGHPVAPPTPTWQAVGDAFATAMAALLLVGIGMTSLLTSVRSRLDRARDAQWEREITCMQENGGRTNQR